MSEKKIVVPEGMVQAAEAACDRRNGATCRQQLEAALRWLSENPIVPTDEQAKELQNRYYGDGHLQQGSAFAYAAVEWQRRMFLAPEPEVPEELREHWKQGNGLEESCHNQTLLLGYRLGQKAGRQ